MMGQLYPQMSILKRFMESSCHNYLVKKKEIEGKEHHENFEDEKKQES